MTDLRLESAYAGATSAVLDTLRQASDSIASTYQESNAVVLATLWSRVAGHFKAGPNENDARSAKWRCRFRIYRKDDLNDPVADSDDEMPSDRPGSMVISGMPNVATELAVLAAIFHGKASVLGLSRQELERRLNALRPTLSRRKGNAVWRVPYYTSEKFNDQTRERGWLMRVDIIREAIGDSDA